MLHIEQVADNIESLTLEWRGTSTLKCIFFESEGSVNFTSRGEDILHWTVELEKSVPIFTSCPPATGALSGGTGVAAALSCSATSTDLLLLRTALYHNCQLASMICRPLRSILEKCHIASRNCTVLYLPLDSVFVFSPFSQYKKTRKRGILCYILWP